MTIVDEPTRQRHRVVAVEADPRIVMTACEGCRG